MAMLTFLRLVQAKITGISPARLLLKQFLRYSQIKSIKNYDHIRSKPSKFPEKDGQSVRPDGRSKHVPRDHFSQGSME
jgi:hypothetical protein